MKQRPTTKQERLKAANEFIKVIASCGRRFFSHEGFVSYLELSKHGRVFFIDYYTKKRIYTHRRYVRWDGFTSGGTLKSLIENLRDFIINNSTMRADYFQPDNSWGYGNDIYLIRNAAIRLGIALTSRDVSRELFKQSGLEYKDLTKRNIQRLRKLINAKMINGHYMGGTFACKQRGSIRLNNEGLVEHSEIRCKSHYFDDREAVSFNRDGFIGFAGWADDTNIKPILSGFNEWVIEMHKSKSAHR